MIAGREVVLRWRRADSETEGPPERYDAASLVDPESSTRRVSYVEVRTQAEAETWGRGIIARYNRTRSGAEVERVFVGAKLFVVLDPFATVVGLGFRGRRPEAIVVRGEVADDAATRAKLAAWLEVARAALASPDGELVVEVDFVRRDDAL